MPQQDISKVLAVMATAGLYDDSGIWLYNVVSRRKRRRWGDHRRVTGEVRDRGLLAAA